MVYCRINTNKLKSLRIQKNINQADMANYIKVSQAMYSMIESGERNCSITTAANIANVLKVSTREFMAELYDSSAGEALVKLIRSCQIKAKHFEALTYMLEHFIKE